MMKTQIENKENTIACTVTSLEYSDTRCRKRIFMDTKRVRSLLVEQGHNPGLSIKESRVDNCEGQLSGTWIFEDADSVAPVIEIIVEKIEEKKTTTSRKRRSSRKSKKVLDKSVEDVIIEE